MRFFPSFGSTSLLAVAVVLVACEAPDAPTGLDPAADVALSASPRGGNAIAAGGGHFDAGVPVQFSFSAVQRDPSGDATGRFHFSADLGGLKIEFHARVTCMTADLDNRRAWIAGVITQNNSEHPGFTTEVHEVGKDIWFRAVDYGQGAQALQPDRTTFVGFEGAAGIITSPEYCEARIWPDDDARTGPLLDGNIQVIG